MHVLGICVRKIQIPKLALIKKIIDEFYSNFRQRQEIYLGRQTSKTKYEIHSFWRAKLFLCLEISENLMFHQKMVILTLVFVLVRSGICYKGGVKESFTVDSTFKKSRRGQS